MITLPEVPSLTPQAPTGGSYFCPCCLKGVPLEKVERRSAHEDVASGALDVDLVRCPRCGLVLAAEVPLPPARGQPAP